MAFAVAEPCPYCKSRFCMARSRDICITLRVNRQTGEKAQSVPGSVAYQTPEPCPLCNSRFCTAHSEDVCITLRKPRPKALTRPERDRMLRGPAVMKEISHAG